MQAKKLARPDGDTASEAEDGPHGPEALREFVSWLRDSEHNMRVDDGEPAVASLCKMLRKLAGALEKTQDIGPELAAAGARGAALDRKEVLRCLRAAGHTIPKGTVLKVVHPSKHPGGAAPRLRLRVP